MSHHRPAARTSAHQPAPTLVIPDRDADLAPSAVPFPSPTRPDASPSPTSPSFPSTSRPSSSDMLISPAASSSRRSPSPGPPAPAKRPAFMRVRQTSLPASLVQSRHHSIVGSAGLSAMMTSAASGGGAKRVSVASFASFDSLPEEEDEGDVDGAEMGRLGLSRRSLSPPATPPRPVAAKRSSLPASSSAVGRGVSVVRPRTLSARTSSPSRWSVMSEGEREKHAETRWRIAEELRESEKAYVRVLEDVDSLYYQPLIEALPADDPLSRRSSKRYSTATQPDSRTTSPRHSLYGAPQPRSRTSTAESLLSTAPSSASTTSPPPIQPILSRREINEVFSNFSDVLNLAHVMLLALEEAVPPRPSQPVSIQPGVAAAPASESTTTHSAPTTAETSGQASSVEDGVEASALSRSGGTVESEGPETPDQSPPTRLTPKFVPRQRPLSTGSTERRRSTPVAPPVRLGKALLPILPFFKQYSLFIANFSASLALLSRLDGSSSITSSASSASHWQAFVASRQQHPGGEQAGEPHSQASKIGLAGLLLNIVQRVPRYRLLLKDLLRHTDDEHTDARDLQAAFDLVDGVASHLDSQISAHTSALALLDLQRSFLPGSFPSSPLVAPGRTLLKSGPLSQVSHSGPPRPRTLFLFSDLLIVAAAEEAWIGDEDRYRLVGRYELDEVTVVGNEEVDQESRRRCGFQVLSRERSFAVYADTLGDRDTWLDAIRSAKAALSTARATIQRSGPSTPLAPVSTSPLLNKLDRRISLPPPSASSTTPHPLARTRSTSSHLGVPPSRQVSLPPSLDFIPPSPAEELDKLIFPSTSSAACEIVQSPLEGPPLAERVEARAGSPAVASSSGTSSRAAILSSPTTSSPTASSSTSTSSSPLASRPSLARSRRWSELPTSSAFAALSSIFLPSPSPSSPDLASGETAYPVIDAYQAPVWVPDSRAPRCQNCARDFGLWRRRHHCRLGGCVVCWECSTKYFVIPAAVLSSPSLDPSSGPAAPPTLSTEPDRLARACDSCFTSVFAPTTPASRFLDAHPTATDTFPRLGMRGGGTGSVKWTGTWRMSKALGPAGGGLAPLWDLEELAAAAAGSDGSGARQSTPTATSAGQGEVRRTRKRSAVKQLKALLGE
ncbi:hypothetical protein JCM3775_000290 [Rhodotorula graminis]